VMDGAANVGIAVTSATLINGNASGIYALPAGLAAKNYTIQAAYSGGTNFLASSNAGTLTVNTTPPPLQISTGTTVNDNAATFSANIQQVTLTATVTVPAGTVNEGTVSFQVMDGATNIGTPVPSATLTNGSAAVSYTLPAGMAVKNYIIQATYSGGPDFLASSGSGTLTIIPAVAVSGLNLAQGSLMSGSSTLATVTLSQLAPANGAVVTITSSVPAAAAVPASIWIPAGSATTAFTVAAGSVATSTSVTISADVNGLGQSAILTVIPPPPVPTSQTPPAERVA